MLVHPTPSSMNRRNRSAGFSILADRYESNVDATRAGRRVDIQGPRYYRVNCWSNPGTAPIRLV